MATHKQGPTSEILKRLDVNYEMDRRSLVKQCRVNLKTPEGQKLKTELEVKYAKKRLHQPIYYNPPITI